MGDGFVNMRSPRFLHHLGKHGFTVVAPLSDPAWEGPKVGGHTAYRVRDMLEVPVKDWTITYQPEYPQDWEEHPDAFRSLQMVGYRSRGPNGPVSVRQFLLNKLFFVVSREWVNEFYHGRRKIEDWLLFLEKREQAAKG